MSAGGIVVAEEVVLSPDADGCPVTVGFLFRFMDFVFGDAAWESFWVFFGPMWVFVGTFFACWFCAVVDCWSFRNEGIEAVWTYKVASEG